MKNTDMDNGFININVDVTCQLMKKKIKIKTAFGSNVKKTKSNL